MSDKNRKMHGIQHLFRQHAVEKQMSADSWSNGSSHNSHVPIADGYSSLRNDSIESESDSSVTSKSPNNWNQGELLTVYCMEMYKIVEQIFIFHKFFTIFFLFAVTFSVYEKEKQNFNLKFERYIRNNRDERVFFCSFISALFTFHFYLVVNLFLIFMLK